MLLAFLAGVVACGLAIPVITRVRERLDRRRARDSDSNQVTSVSQVLHLAVGGSPSGITVLSKDKEIIFSNPTAHEMSMVHDRAVNPDVWSVAQEVFAVSYTHLRAHETTE